MARMDGGRADEHSSGAGSADHDDRALIVRLLDGDEQAARWLIDRYDALIRYTVFRTARRHCDRDPGWLDARANETWTGIVSSLRRLGTDGIPPSIPSYFSQIARNKALDAAAKADVRPIIPFDSEVEAGLDAEPTTDPEDDPADLLAGLEQLETLRACLNRLSEEDRVLCSEIELIMNRRWREASERLGMAESTLRSRWNGVLGRLRGCLNKKKEKGGESFAPDPDSPDS